MAKILFVQAIPVELMGTMVLSAYLKSRGHQTDLLIEPNPRRVARVAAKESVQVVGFYTSTGSHHFALACAREIKRVSKKTVTVLGGPHATFFPEIVESPHIDAVIRGEAEESLTELMCATESGRIAGIQNVWVKEEGVVLKNPLRPLMDDLDVLPFPDRDIYYRKYSFLRLFPVKYFVSGRGCPFACSYCYNHSLRRLYGNAQDYVRRKSVEAFVSEIEQAKREFPLKAIRFEDDTFSLDRDWILRFAEEYARRIRIPYCCYLRPGTFDEDVVIALKESGCYLATVSVETGSERLRNSVLRKGVTDEQIFESANFLQKHRLRFFTQNMFALPDETIEDGIQTYKINRMIRPDHMWASVLSPYPGTEIAKLLKERGVSLPSPDSFSGDYHALSLLPGCEVKGLVNLHHLSPAALRLGLPSALLAFLARLPANPLFNLIHSVSYIPGLARRMRTSLLRASIIALKFCLSQRNWREK
jgi:radical SAM superfamily enzyme YgiQ (UPF0313 family)